jgi:dihydrofolate reductase
MRDGYGIKGQRRATTTFSSSSDEELDHFTTLLAAGCVSERSAPCGGKVRRRSPRVRLHVDVDDVDSDDRTALSAACRVRRRWSTWANAQREESEMGRIVVSENVSLDGVIQDPAGDEGFRVGGWVGLIKDSPQINKLALDEALGAEALLLGRRSYEWFAARWPSRSGELADRLNSLPKYVVSSTLEEPRWGNSTVLKGDVVNEVSKLKQELNGEIVVPASFQLLRLLMEHDLVDELRLKIFPVVLGAGERLFGETSDEKPMRLLDAQTIEGGIAYLTYQPVRDA